LKPTQDPSERLYYLGKYTTGATEEAVSGLLSLDNVDAFSKAKKILTNRFGNPFTVADAFRKRINSWPKIQPNDGQSLRKFSDFLGDNFLFMAIMKEKCVRCLHG